MLLQPTMTIADAATLPTIDAAIRSRFGHSHPVTTVCRRYRVTPAIAGSLQSATPPVRVGQDWTRMDTA
jgi:hypothetical protein